ncbi:MAG: hypothetical protein EOO05_12340 [Chitinophagaceae bacterium]|nr:MAG: hypothetical protein EOO05_12340 [Chitinophagaceae bacterium]
MPQAYYDESAASAATPAGAAITPPVNQAQPMVDGTAENDLYTFEGFTVESNTKVLLIPKMNHRKHG